MENVIVIGFGILAVITLCFKVYELFNHSHCANPAKLRVNARIVDVKHTKVGTKNDVKICTEVYFDDGFRYETYQTDRENHFFSYTVGVGRETSNEILERAKEAHQKALEKAQRRRQCAVDNLPNDSQEKKRENLEREYTKTYLQTQSKPLGGEEEAWNWMRERLQYFKAAGLEQDKLAELGCNVVLNLPESYRKFLPDFLALAGGVTPILLACGRLLADEKAQAAKETAAPYLQYLLAHPEKYAQGRSCIQSREEAMLCQLEGCKLDGPPTEDNYTLFFLVYCKILDNILAFSPEEADARKREKLRCLKIAARISPCNAAVWKELAAIYLNQDEPYQEYSGKALRYCLEKGEPFGLGAIYGDMAVHYAEKDPVLAKALCMVSKMNDGKPFAAEYILSKKDVAEPEYPRTVLRNAGIQEGFSPLVKAVREANLKLSGKDE